MPTYDYQCLSCQHQFEAFQSMKDEPLKECPQCGKEVKRLIGGGLGVIFKGSGFYTTDYKKSSAANAPLNKDKTDSAAKTDKPVEKSETKPAGEKKKEPVKV